MTWQLRRSERAQEDLVEIWLYIAVEDSVAADRLVDAIGAAFGRTADFPRIGKAIDEIARDHRTLVHGNYLIVYRVDEAAHACELVRVLHGARRWADLIA